MVPQSTSMGIGGIQIGARLLQTLGFGDESMDRGFIHRSDGDVASRHVPRDSFEGRKARQRAWTG